jgi:hypothetical protein
VAVGHQRAIELTGIRLGCEFGHIPGQRRSGGDGGDGGELNGGTSSDNTAFSQARS